MTRLRRHTIHKAKVTREMLFAQLVTKAGPMVESSGHRRREDPDDPELFTWFGGTLYDDDDGMH